MRIYYYLLDLNLKIPNDLILKRSDEIISIHSLYYS